MCKAIGICLIIFPILSAIISYGIDLLQIGKFEGELAHQAVECWKSEFDNLPKTGDIQLDHLILLQRASYGKDVTTQQFDKFFELIKGYVEYYIVLYRHDYKNWKWEKTSKHKKNNNNLYLIDSFGNEVEGMDNRLINLDLDHTDVSSLVISALDKSGIPRQVIPHKLFLNIDPYAMCYETNLKKIGVCNSTLRCNEPPKTDRVKYTWIREHAPKCPVPWKYSKMGEQNPPEDATMCMDFHGLYK